MKTISLAELRQNPTQAIDEVETGKTYLVTRHRRPVAKLVPITDNSALQIVPAATPRQRPRIRELAHWPRQSEAEIAEMIEWVKGDR